MTDVFSELLHQICGLAEQAGQRIMQVSCRPHLVATKEDKSPLTEADQASHTCIVAGLKQLAPKDVVVSEEDVPEFGRGENVLTDFWLVAEGKADIYLRDVPTMEWDTAAAHCVVEEAGGAIFTLEGRALTYGKPEFRNPLLMTVGHPDFDWQSLMPENGGTQTANGRQ